MKHTWINWTIGMVGVSWILGSIIAWVVWQTLHNYFDRTVREKGWDIDEWSRERINIYPFIIGLLERTLFTILIAFKVPGVAAGMMIWAGLKMSTGWGRISGGKAVHRMLAFTGLIASMTSLSIAVIGGLIANGSIPIYLLFK